MEQFFQVWLDELWPLTIQICGLKEIAVLRMRVHFLQLGQ